MEKKLKDTCISINMKNPQLSGELGTAQHKIVKLPLFIQHIKKFHTVKIV